MQIAPVGSSPHADRLSDDGRTALPIVLLRDVEPAMADLYEAWLSLEGLRVRRQAMPDETVALIIIDVAFPRQDGRERLRELARVWPGVPALVLSSTFLPGIAAQGDVARQLGATAVLAAPVARETLRGAVDRLLNSARAA